MKIERDTDPYRRCAHILTQAGWTVHPPGTSCIGADHAFDGKRETSMGASVYVKPRTGTQRDLILKYLITHGPRTDVQLQQVLHMSPNSERPRRLELVEGGFVKDSGERMKHHGQEHIIWAAVTYDS